MAHIIIYKYLKPVENLCHKKLTAKNSPINKGLCFYTYVSKLNI